MQHWRANLLYSTTLFLILFLVFEFGVDPDVLVSESLTNTPLGDLLPFNRLFETLSSMPFVLALIKFFLVLFCGMAISRLAIRNLVFVQHTYTPFVLFLILSCSITSDNIALLVSCALIVSSLSRFLKAFRHGDSINELFVASFYIGLSALVTPCTVVFFPMILFLLPILNRHWREYIGAIAGLILPLFLCGYVYWAIGWGFTALPETIFKVFTSGNFSIFSNINAGLNMHFVALIVYVIAVIVCFVFSLIDFVKNYSVTRGRPRRALLVAFLYLIFIVLMSLLPQSCLSAMVLSSVPLSIILTICLSKDTVFNRILYFIIIISVVVMHL